MNKDGKVRVIALKELVRRVATITTTLDTSGIKLRFINFKEDGGFNDIRTVPEVDKAMKIAGFRGKRTEIGMGLESKILDPLLFAKIQAGTLRKPLLITTITDGAVWIYTHFPRTVVS